MLKYHLSEEITCKYNTYIFSYYVAKRWFCEIKPLQTIPMCIEVTLTFFSSHVRTFNSSRTLILSTLDIIQDFLCKLGHETTCRLVEISIFFTKSCPRQTYQNYSGNYLCSTGFTEVLNNFGRSDDGMI